MCKLLFNTLAGKGRGVGIGKLLHDILMGKGEWEIGLLLHDTLVGKGGGIIRGMIQKYAENGRHFYIV